jgi:hypothetical protein
MRKDFTSALVLVSTVFLAACSSTPKPVRHRPDEWHPPVEMLEKYADKDGVVTRAAMEAGLKADFARADLNHDGCLDADEARIVNEERWQTNESTASPLIDFKQNGCIDFDEFAATPRSLFDQLDKRGTGRLTPAQLHPGRKPTSPPAQQPGHPATPGNGS